MLVVYLHQHITNHPTMFIDIIVIAYLRKRKKNNWWEAGNLVTWKITKRINNSNWDATEDTQPQ